MIALVLDMSKKKVPSDEELTDVKVEVPRQKKHRREAETGDVVRHKRRDAELSDVKVEGVRHKHRREVDPSDDKTIATRPKKRRDVELGDVATHKPRHDANPSDVRVAGARQKHRRNTLSDSASFGEGKRDKSKVSSRSSDYVYDNKAYVGSANNLVEARNDRIHEPPTSVYREQYWTCSKWSLAKKVLAIGVGVALGAGIGLAVILVVTGKDAEDVISGIFMASAPD